MRNVCRLSLSAVVLLFTAAVLRAESSNALGAKVIAYCRQHLGKQVGRGECAHLAWYALPAAGAMRRGGPDFPGPDDYVWGKQVYLLEVVAGRQKATGQLAGVRPGDIIQFRNTRWGKHGHANHHTAVVASVNPHTRTIETFQQNWDGKRYVIKYPFRLGQLRRGWIRIYRPIPVSQQARAGQPGAR